MVCVNLLTLKFLNLQIMKLSVLLAVLCYCRTISCRRIMDQIETNEVDVGPEENLGFSNSQEWIKISEPPLANMAAMVGTRVELECEAIGSPTPVMQWFKDHQKLTEVITKKKSIAKLQLSCTSWIGIALW